MANSLNCTQNGKNVQISLRMAKSPNCTQNGKNPNCTQDGQSPHCTQDGQKSKLHSERPKVQITLRKDKSTNCTQNGQKYKLHSEWTKLHFAFALRLFVCALINKICISIPTAHFVIFFLFVARQWQCIMQFSFQHVRNISLGMMVQSLLVGNIYIT